VVVLGEHDSQAHGRMVAPRRWWDLAVREGSRPSTDTEPRVLPRRGSSTRGYPSEGDLKPQLDRSRLAPSWEKSRSPARAGRHLASGGANRSRCGLLHLG